MKAITRLEKSKHFWLLILFSFLFFLLRLPSLYEPYWYGDEGVYQAVGMLIRSGESLYSGAWENKPPLLLVIYALFNSDQFALRSLSLVFGLISLWFFFLTSRTLFPASKYAPGVSTAAFLFIFGTRLIEGNIANAENFMILPIMISAYLVVSTDLWKKLWHIKSFTAAGLILSLAFFIKIVAIFDFFAFSSFLLITKGDLLKEKIRNKLIPFSIGFILLPIAIASYFLLTNNFKGFLDALLLQNITYVGFGNELLIPQGFLYLKAILLVAFVGVVFILRNKLERRIIFVILWFAFSLFNAFFSQRPYTHYLITLLPSFALLIGLVIEEKRFKLPLLGILIAGFIVVNYTFNLKFEFISHYTNLVSFFTNKISLSQYQAFFDTNTPRDYEIAMYIKINTMENERVFIWGNNAQVYKLSNKTPITRYTVAYHITNFPNGIPEMEEAISNKKPGLIVVMPNVVPFPLALNNYNEKIIISDAIIYERVL